MSDDPWAGRSALVLLWRLQWRGRRRLWTRGLRQPRKLLSVLVAVAVLAFFVWGRSLGGDGAGRLGGQSGGTVVPLVITFFALTSLLSSLSAGNLAFTPPEAQFLLPGPVGTRALVIGQLLGAFGKSLFGAGFFALLLAPSGMGWLRAFVGYALLFAVLILIGSAVDLGHALVPREVRRRRARRLGLGLLGAALVVVGLTCRLEGPWRRDTGEPWPRLTNVDGSEVLAPASGAARGPTWVSTRAIRHLGWPGRPLAGVLRPGPPGEALRDHALVLLLAGGLMTWQLRRARGVREAASETSKVVSQALDRARRGRVQLDRTARTSSGRLVPMLPRMGGAGPHAWRQLSILARQRKSYLTLVIAALFMGAINLFVTEGSVAVVAGTVLGWIAVMGPFYVQCDFRSDYDSLAWLRSLPCSPTALAAGQILASALVLTALELLLAGWVLLLPGLEARAVWVVAFAALPFANLLQLAVENGAWLLFPVRTSGDRSTPGTMHVGRMYALMMAKFAILGVAALPWLAGAWFGGPWGALAAGVPTATALCALGTWLLGRIFLRVDPAGDLDG